MAKLLSAVAMLLASTAFGQGLGQVRQTKIDPETGAGFVDVGSVQIALGLTGLPSPASSFTYNSVDDFAVLYQSPMGMGTSVIQASVYGKLVSVPAYAQNRLVGFGMTGWSDHKSTCPNAGDPMPGQPGAVIVRVMPIVRVGPGIISNSSLSVNGAKLTFAWGGTW